MLGGGSPAPCAWAPKVGDGGCVPQSRNRRVTSHRNEDISFFLMYYNFAFSNIFKIKWPKFEDKVNFWGGGFGYP